MAFVGFKKGQYPKPKGRTTRRGTMNGLEKKYDAHLRLQVHAGLVAGYWFESLRFRLANKTYYTPDFLVMLADGTLELHECKGFMRSRDAVRLKVTSETYWLFPVKLVKASKGGFTVTDLA